MTKYITSSIAAKRLLPKQTFPKQWRNTKSTCLLVALFLVIDVSLAQPVPQTDIGLQDFSRLKQISDSTSADRASYFFRSSFHFWNQALNDSFSPTSKTRLQWVQAGLQTRYNSQMAMGVNDGSMLPARGLQNRLTVGLHVQYQNWSLLLQPEFVHAANTDLLPFVGDPGNYWAKVYVNIHNKIDAFERPGTAPVTQFFPGQSALRYNFKTTSIGISTENLWWGPARNNSLVLTNNAPGFLHATFQTRRPIENDWGKWEFQFIYGALQNTGWENPDHAFMRTYWVGGIAPKSNQSRSLFGYNIGFSPKALPNFYVGAAGVSYFYASAAALQPADLVLPYENKKAPARLGALFFRYKMPKENAEVYAEYGRSNRWAAPWNLFGDTLPTGYTIGVRKGFDQKKGGHIWLSAELTQLQLPDARLIFDVDAPGGRPKTNSWYTHTYVAQGYSHQAQTLGAAIGPGSNAFSVNLDYIKGLKRIGLGVERVAVNNDFTIYNYYSGVLGSGYTDRYWVNLNWSLNAQWDWGPWLLTASYQHTQALNYRWVKQDPGFSTPSPASDRKNAQFQLGLYYFFKRPIFTAP